jgi:SAM-dependent methyltransferase
VLAALEPIRDRVLANARIAPGETLLDVGCGDGLIGFGALPLVGERGSVVFSDISPDLLDVAAETAREAGVEGCCRFVRAAAEDLAPIGGAAIDVVTTRSVLIYVANKARAFAEFFRVLRQGGRISLFEPINRFGYDRPRYDMTPVADLAAKVRAALEEPHSIDLDPMLGFDERDLLAWAEAAGFREIHLELQAEIAPAAPRCWETMLDTAGNPLDPTLGELLERTLTPAERRRYEAHLRPLVEAGQGVQLGALAYLWAVK